MPISLSSTPLKPAHFFAQKAKAETSEKPTKPTDATDVVLLKQKAAKLAEETVDAYIKAVPEGKEDLNKFLDEAETVVKNPTDAKRKWLKKAAENPILNVGITFGDQLAEAFVPTLPKDIRPVVFDLTDWLFAPETLPKHEKKPSPNTH